MLSFEEYVKANPNPSYKGYYEDYKEYVEKQSEKSFEESQKRIEEDIMKMIVDEEEIERAKKRRKDRENICPHCNKPLQKEKAVLYTTHRKALINSQTTYLPAGGWRKREKYKTYEVKYYLCKECENTLKRISQIRERAHRISLRVAAIVTIIVFVIFEVLAISSGEDFWTILIVSLFLGVGGAMALFVVLALILQEVLSKKAKEIEKETGIILYPHFPEVDEAADIDKRIDALKL